MLNSKSESKSLRVSYAGENGVAVLSCSATYGDSGINISCDMLEREYCSAHKEEVETAVAAFISRLNGLLSEGGFPEVKTA